MKRGTIVRPRRGKLVEIEWVDSIHDSQGWQLTAVEDVEDDQDHLKHKTAGYVLKDGKRAITVAQSINPHTGHTDARMTIPRWALISVRVVS